MKWLSRALRGRPQPRSSTDLEESRARTWTSSCVDQLLPVLKPDTTWLHYMLFGYERVGEASGLTRFGRRKWFDEGAGYLVRDAELRRELGRRHGRGARHGLRAAVPLSRPRRRWSCRSFSSTAAGTTAPATWPRSFRSCAAPPSATSTGRSSRSTNARRAARGADPVPRQRPAPQTHRRSGAAPHRKADGAAEGARRRSCRGLLRHAGDRHPRRHRRDAAADRQGPAARRALRSHCSAKASSRRAIPTSWEEVPREGLSFVTRFERTCWADGRVVVWLGAASSPAAAKARAASVSISRSDAPGIDPPLTALPESTPPAVLERRPARRLPAPRPRGRRQGVHERVGGMFRRRRPNAGLAQV